MNIEEVREYCLQKKGVTEGFPFDEWNLVMKVAGKMFALLDLESSSRIALKCDPEYAVELRERYDGITGAYHFNKKYWNDVSLQGDVDTKMICRLIEHSYEEVVRKFPRKLRSEYEALP